MHTDTLEPSPGASRQTDPQDARERKVRTAFWFGALLSGALQAWNNRHVMNSDGICYLNLGDAYLAEGWKGLINGHWSPFYPWLVAMARMVLRLSGYWSSQLFTWSIFCPLFAPQPHLNS